MRKVLAIAGALCLLASAALAITGSDQAKVAYEVTPSISFGSTGGGIPALPSGNPFDAGGLTLAALFKPHVNTQYVDMYPCATPLYKGDTPTVGGVANNNVINLAADKPAKIYGTSGFSPATQDFPLPLAAGAFTFDGVNGWPKACGAAVRFHSGSTGSFSHDVNVSAVWYSNNTELPTGGYSGYLQLYVATVP